MLHQPRKPGANRVKITEVNSLNLVSKFTPTLSFIPKRCLFLALSTAEVPFKHKNSWKVPTGWINVVPSLNTARIKTVRVSVCISPFFSKNAWPAQIIRILLEVRGELKDDIKFSMSL